MAVKLALFLLTTGAGLLYTEYLRRAWHPSGLLLTGIILSLAFLEGLFLLAFHLWIYPAFYNPLRSVPLAPRWSPWLGHAFQDMGKDKVHGTTVRKWVNEMPNEHVIRHMDLFQNQSLMPLSPQALADVLTNNCYDFEKPGFVRRGFALGILGNGLVLAEGNEHKRQRKQFNPAFTFRHIRDLYPTFWRCSLDLVRFVQNCADKEAGGSTVIDPNELSSRATLDILGEAGFGKSFESVENPNNPLSNAYHALFEDKVTTVLCDIAEQLLPSAFVMNLPIKRNRRVKASFKTIRDTCRALIRRKRAEMDEKGHLSTADILSVILSQEKVNVTEDEMVEQLVTFLGAGHETTAAAFAWVLLVFCQRPEFPRRIRDEVLDRFPAAAWDKANPSLSSSDLESCAYLNAFCSEMLRVYPPVPGTVRQAVRDTVVAGYAVPKGTQLAILPWAVNVCPALWGPDAAEFRPERWLENPGSGGCVSNYANMTFIHGPRNCIGSAFAKGEFLCLVAAWAVHFDTQFHKEEGWKEPTVDMLSSIAARPSRGWKAEVKVVQRWGA